MANPTTVPFPRPAAATLAHRPDVAGLIELILVRYHETHRREFPQAIRLARQVEAAQGGHPACPHGLADHLASMAADLEDRQQWEEQVVFPMVVGGGGPRRRVLLARMVAEHETAAAQLRRLQVLAKGYEVPPGAGDGWSALMRACRKLDFDLRAHMRLEAKLRVPNGRGASAWEAEGGALATSHSERAGEAAAGRTVRRRQTAH